MEAGNRQEPPYDDDVYGWSLHQAELLRAGRYDDVDIENVAEEIESWGDHRPLLWNRAIGLSPFICSRSCSSPNA